MVPKDTVSLLWQTYFPDFSSPTFFSAFTHDLPPFRMKFLELSWSWPQLQFQYDQQQTHGWRTRPPSAGPVTFKSPLPACFEVLGYCIELKI